MAHCISIGGTTPAGSRRQRQKALERTFPLALSALIQEAIAAEHTEHDDSEIVGEPEAGALVDLSSMDAG